MTPHDVGLISVGGAARARNVKFKILWCHLLLGACRPQTPGHTHTLDKTGVLCCAAFLGVRNWLVKVLQCRHTDTSRNRAYKCFSLRKVFGVHACVFSSRVTCARRRPTNPTAQEDVPSTGRPSPCFFNYVTMASLHLGVFDRWLPSHLDLPLRHLHATRLRDSA